MSGNELLIEQLQIGPMQNFVYVVGSRTTREVVLVDPAWDIDALSSHLDEQGYTLTGALVTHYHPDHIGGDLFGIAIEGLRELMTVHPVPVHANRDEALGIRAMTGLSPGDLDLHGGGDAVMAGDVPVVLVHTPGHTPGSQCFLVGNRLVSGDTLFVGGCGRVDLPGSDPDEMYLTLTQRLAKLPADTVLYPGHDYGPTRTSTLGEERASNQYMRIRSIEDWRALMS